MADAKISALPADSTPAGTDEIPVNQGGATKKITLSQINGYCDPLRVAATAAQGGFASDTYVTGSRVVLPQAKMQAGTFYRCQMVITKSAAGVATPIFVLRSGTAGSVADTSRLSYTGVAQTAAVDVAFLEFLATFRVVGASAILSSWVHFNHDAAVTGFANITRDFQGSTVSSAFDSTTAGMGLGVSMNGGTSAAWTVQECVTELLNLAD